MQIEGYFFHRTLYDDILGKKAIIQLKSLFSASHFIRRFASVGGHVRDAINTLCYNVSIRRVSINYCVSVFPAEIFLSPTSARNIFFPMLIRLTHSTDDTFTD